MMPGDPAKLMGVNCSAGIWVSLTTFVPMTDMMLWAVNNISFTLEEGKTIALVGESGSGKSTIVRMIAKLERPSSGQILIDGVLLDPQHEHTKTLLAAAPDPKNQGKLRYEVGAAFAAQK